MKRYIFITEGLNKVDILLKSIKEETGYKISNYVSLENLEELQHCSTVAFIYHNNSNFFPFYDIDQTSQQSDNYFQNITSDFWNKIKELNLVIDLITCTLNQDYQITSINTISKEYGIHFRYSLDETGNYNVGGDWILENSTDISEKNTDIKNLYFNDEIKNWDVILSFTPTITSYVTTDTNEIKLIINGGIPDYYFIYYMIVFVKMSINFEGNWKSTTAIFNGQFRSVFELIISKQYLESLGNLSSFGRSCDLEISLLTSDGKTYKTQGRYGIYTYLKSYLTFDSFYTNGRDCAKFKVNLNFYMTRVNLSLSGLCYSTYNKIPTTNDSKLITNLKNDHTGLNVTTFSYNGQSFSVDPLYFSAEIVFGNTYYIRFFYQLYYDETDYYLIQNTATYYSLVYILPTCLKPIVNSDLLVSVSINTPELLDEYGVCWNTVTGPTISNSTHIMGTNVSGSLNSTFQLTNLLPYKIYYIKTYIKHGGNIYYSFEETSFITKPMISTLLPTFENNSTAISGSYFLVQEFVSVETGVCWSIYPNPTILFSKNSIKSIIITKINSPQRNNIKMTLLSAETYYVRAYVIIDTIIYYGDERIYSHITPKLKIDLIPYSPTEKLIQRGKCICSLNIPNNSITVINCGISYYYINGTDNRTVSNDQYYNNKSPYVFTDKIPIEITIMFDIDKVYYVSFFCNIKDSIDPTRTIKYSSNIFVLPIFGPPFIAPDYSNLSNGVPIIVDYDRFKTINGYDYRGICWNTGPSSPSVITDFNIIVGWDDTIILKHFLPSTTYYMNSYVKINSKIFYSYTTLKFTTLSPNTNNIVFPNPTTIFNNKSYIGNYRLDLSGSNFSDLNLSEYYMGGVNLDNANFNNITTKNILGQPMLSSGYKNNYGFILGKNINMINPVITNDMKDIFYNIDLTNSNIVDAHIVPYCLVDSTTYVDTKFTSTNDIGFKQIKPGVSFCKKELLYKDLIFPIDHEDTFEPIGPTTKKYVKTKYGILISYIETNSRFIIKWNECDLSDKDISDCPLELFEYTSFKNIKSNSNTKLPTGLLIINKYIIGPKMILINVDFNNVVATINIDLAGIISGGILNYDNISFSNNYRMIKNSTSSTYGIKDLEFVSKISLITDNELINEGGIIVGPNTNFKNIVFKENDLSELILINVVFDGCNFIGCFGKVNTVDNVKFINCDYQIIGNYIVGPNVSLENANFQNNNYLISASLRNVSSKNIQNYANVGFKNNTYQIINGCIFGKEVNVKDVEFNGETVAVDLTDIISSNIRGSLKFINNRYFLLEGFIIGPKVHYETIKITTEHSKNVLLNIFYENTIGVAVGDGPSNTIAYSYDGITWIGLGKNIFSTRGYGVAYNGSKWVAVGEGTNSVAYSSNGFSWETLGIGVMSVGKSVAWNGVSWFILGDDSFGATSNDGITWNKFSIDSLSKGRAVIWNGNYWLIVGEIAGTSGILYSTNGITWNTKVTGFSCSCYGAEWNGTKTVVVGEYAGGNGGSIIYSLDNDDWVAVGENIFSTRVNGVASNENGDWVAVGEGTNTIAYSEDGIAWIPIQNTLFSVGKSVSWNKKYWVALGEGKNTIAYSKDGINWTGAGTDIFSNGENLTWDGILTNSSISNYSDSDQVNIFNIILRYDPNSILPILLETDISNDDILITPQTFQGDPISKRYYPNFNVNNKLTIVLNDNEYFTITKLWRKTKYQTINIFYKYIKFEKNALDTFTETYSAIYDKGKTLKIKKYKIVLQ